MRVDNNIIDINGDTAATASPATTNGGVGSKRIIIPRKQVQLEEFLSLEVPHPYGVQPEGNRFLQVPSTNTNDAASTTTKSENSAATKEESAAATIATTTSSISPTNLLTDECWNSILQFCNGIDLARIGQTCRYFYVSSHLPELWRDLVLHKLHHHNQNDNSNNANESKEKVLEHFYHSWKDTYIRCYLSMDCHPQEALQKLENLHPHHPMMVAGIYSDFLYRLHTCRSFAIPEAWLTCAMKQQQDQQDQDQLYYDTQGLVPRVSASDMTVQRFQDEFENANFPVVIAGGAADWKATQQWNQLSYLLEMATITPPPPPPPPPVNTTSSSSNGSNSMAAAIAAATASSTNNHDDDGGGALPKKQQPPEHSQYHGQMTFRATSGTAPLPATFTLPAYLDYCETSVTNLMEEAPLYLFDRSSLIQPSSSASSEPVSLEQQDETAEAEATTTTHHHACFDDFRPCLARTCPYWDCQISPQHDLFRLLGEGKRPDHTWLIIGARRSGSVFHIDPNATHAWNATIVGRKRWIFYPPTTSATGIFCSNSNSNNDDDDADIDDDHLPPPGVHPSPDGDSVALPLSVGEWLQQFWPEHCRRMKQYSVKSQRSQQQKQQQDSKDTVQQQQQQQHQQHFLRPLECTTGPGDIVFVPHGWWHTVINLDEINIAITHNYVSGGSSYVHNGSGSSGDNGTKSDSIVAAAAAAASVNHGDHNNNNNNNKKHKNKHSNLPDVLRFLREKRDQVSGCRDRPNEAIQPDCLYEEFVAALKRHYPEMLETALEAVKEEEQLEQEHQQAHEQAQGGKSRNMLDRRRRHRHQERKKRQREKLEDEDEATTSKKKSSATDDDDQDTSIMAKGKSQNENGNFSFSFF